MLNHTSVCQLARAAAKIMSVGVRNGVGKQGVDLPGGGWQEAGRFLVPVPQGLRTPGSSTSHLICRARCKMKVRVVLFKKY